MKLKELELSLNESCIEYKTKNAEIESIIKNFSNICNEYENKMLNTSPSKIISELQNKKDILLREISELQTKCKERKEILLKLQQMNDKLCELKEENKQYTLSIESQKKILKDLCDEYEEMKRSKDVIEISERIESLKDDKSMLETFLESMKIQKSKLLSIKDELLKKAEWLDRALNEKKL